jgi:hypothetical protein
MTTKKSKKSNNTQSTELEDAIKEVERCCGIGDEFCSYLKSLFTGKMHVSTFVKRFNKKFASFHSDDGDNQGDFVSGCFSDKLPWTAEMLIEALYWVDYSEHAAHIIESEKFKEEHVEEVSKALKYLAVKYEKADFDLSHVFYLNGPEFVFKVKESLAGFDVTKLDKETKRQILESVKKPSKKKKEYLGFMLIQRKFDEIGCNEAIAAGIAGVTNFGKKLKIFRYLDKSTSEEYIAFCKSIKDARKMIIDHICDFDDFDPEDAKVIKGLIGKNLEDVTKSIEVINSIRTIQTAKKAR